MLAALVVLAALLLTPNPAAEANYQPRLTKPAASHQAVSNRPGASSQPQAVVIRALISAYCIKYDVEFEFALAVALNESGKTLKCGPLGKRGIYAGPFGLRRDCYIEKYGIDPVGLEDNVRLGVLTLANLLKAKHGDKVAAMKVYNKTWWENNYLRDVLACYRQFKQEKVGVSG